QEGNYRAALCLLRLQRVEEALGRLEALAAEPGERWPLLAAVHLWIGRLDRKQFPEGDAIFTGLSARYSSEALQQHVPRELLLGIFDRYPVLPAETLAPDPGRMARVEQLNRLADYLRLEQ